MTIQELYDYAKKMNCLDYQINLLDWPFNGDYTKVTSKKMDNVSTDPKDKTILIS